MPEFSDFTLPRLPAGWSYFATLQDGFFVVVIVLLITLLITWWRQQSRHWFRITTAALLSAIVLCIASFYVFIVPPYEVGCTALCTGWRGFPRPLALITLDGMSWIGPIDFGMNVALLWLIVLTVTMLWRILILSIGWENRLYRTRFLLIIFFWMVPWALLPRFLEPPQPVVIGEDLRVANNAMRAAEFTYNLTGLWVQRLSIEDIRSSRGLGESVEPEEGVGDADQGRANPGSRGEAFSSLSSNQVCLRGYTFFFLPWQRYRIVLEASGVSSVQMIPVPLTGSCWE